MVTLQKVDLDLLVKELCEYHIRLIGYEKQAHRELKDNIARLFKALSFSKQIQALYILDYMGCMGSTNENLSVLIGHKETCNFDDTCEDSGTREVIERFYEIEEKSKHLYTCAKDSAESEKDLSLGNISVCSKCGYVLAGDAPKECVVCHSPSGYFRLF